MKSRSIKSPTFAVLYNIRSVYNVGSIFRTAECLGVSELILVGYTPAPVDRFGRPRKDFSKVALGAEATLPWRSFSNMPAVLKFLKTKHARIVAVEQASGALDYKDIRVKPPVAFIFGNEVGGIPPAVLLRCDTVVEIKMRGKKESLNVSIAAAIVLARALNS